MPVTAGSPWLPFGAGGDAGIRILCLPHAGAGASVYRVWGRGLPAGTWSSSAGPTPR
jgi:medium-chain acyl-[acyl-carrier-protein] hydrolase